MSTTKKQYIPRLIKTNLVQLSVNLVVELKRKKLSSTVYNLANPEVIHEIPGKLTLAAVPLQSSPHFLFATGREKVYEDYLKFAKKYSGTEHTVDSFKALLESVKCADYSNSTQGRIRVYKVKDLIVIKDGAHHAAALLASGVKDANIEYVTNTDTYGRTLHIKEASDVSKKLNRLTTEHRLVHLEANGNRHDAKLLLKEYFETFRNTFMEWYTPHTITNKLVIDVKTYPKFQVKPEYHTNKERGQSKWDYIISENLPDLRDKTVLDIGCSSGLFSYLMAHDHGAKLVHGIDRNEDIIQPTNPKLPQQNVSNQAWFITNMLCFRDNFPRHKLNFFDVDIETFDFSKTKYDVVFACCILYHFRSKMDEKIEQLSHCCNEIFLQTNLGHANKLGKYPTVDYHIEVLKKHGFKIVKIVEPDGYKYPVIYAKKNETGQNITDDLESLSSDSESDYEPEFDEFGRCYDCGKKERKCRCAERLRHESQIRREARHAANEQKRRELEELKEYEIQRDQNLMDLYNGKKSKRHMRRQQYYQDTYEQRAERDKIKGVRQLDDYDKIKKQYKHGKGKKIGKINQADLGRNHKDDTHISRVRREGDIILPSSLREEDEIIGMDHKTKQRRYRISEQLKSTHRLNRDVRNEQGDSETEYESSGSEQDYYGNDQYYDKYGSRYNYDSQYY